MDLRVLGPLTMDDVLDAEEALERVSTLAHIFGPELAPVNSLSRRPFVRAAMERQCDHCPHRARQHRGRPATVFEDGHLHTIHLPSACVSCRCIAFSFEGDAL